MATLQRTALAAATAAAAALVTMGSQASAAPGDGADRLTMQGAMQRDLGLTAAEAVDRLASEKVAAATDKTLKSGLGSSYAGSWYDATSGKLVVAVTDAAAARTAKAQGADAVTVQRSAADLDAVVKQLDQASAPSAVAAWYVDSATNQVVVPSQDVAAAEAFVADAGVDADAVRVEKAPEDPQPLAQGGDAYIIENSSRCSIGFAVNGGFVSAGHCGSVGDTTSPAGTFAGSSFPGNDYAYVQTSAAVSGSVNGYGGPNVAVRGSSEAPTGSSICRSGSTTGWFCGTIQSRGATVNYAEGSVSGLIRTSVCAEPGDSGGSAISGSQAQGVTSGGSGNCTLGGTTYFQPVNEILNVYGLTLTTS